MANTKRERARLQRWAEREAWRAPGGREGARGMHEPGGLEYLAGEDPRAPARASRGPVPHGRVWDHQSRSPFEDELARALRRAGVSGFEQNARLGPWELDFVWRREKLAVEVDGFTHLSNERRELDRRKELVLAEQGYRLLRFQNQEVRARPAACVRRIREALRGS
ncbi:endonuclease domain-containing protein [Limnochorda pilosa]|uniref:DUF559 domain-containing protein n=1 Tax=Limnochorda pilosa TaxID=1555112 RepID=A0A0K2SG05_LIMPI|nr:DUF559 domain-containing protein [Limnochorda pilosa]BAS26025.1 hypothetical protein LIP_0168 [Limnochorda pilosa]